MDVDAVTNAAVSHAAASGHFERVNLHEPKNAPGHGLTCAVWCQAVAPIPAASGLAATSGRLLFNVRIFSSMLQEPQDAIDPNVLKAVDRLLELYSGDFTLGGLVRNVDLLGAYGVPLSAQAGYQSIDKTMYRIMTINLPLVVSDLWSQSP